MKTDVIQIVAEIAGLAGISIAFVFYTFRGIIQKNIFPQLTKEQAYKTINRIIFSTVLIAIIGIFAWVYTTQRDIEPKKEPLETEEISLRKIDINGVIRDIKTQQPIQGIIVKLTSYDVESTPSNIKGEFQIKNTIKSTRDEVDLYIDNKSYELVNKTVDLMKTRLIIKLRRKG